MAKETKEAGAGQVMSPKIMVGGKEYGPEEVERLVAERQQFAQGMNQQGQRVNELAERLAKVEASATAKPAEPQEEPFDLPGLNEDFAELMRGPGGGTPAGDFGYSGQAALPYALLRQVQDFQNRLNELEKRQPLIDKFYDDYTTFREHVQGNFGRFDQADFEDRVSYAVEEAGVPTDSKYFPYVVRDLLDAKRRADQSGQGFDFATELQTATGRFQSELTWQNEQAEAAKAAQAEQAAAGATVPATGVPAGSGGPEGTPSPGPSYSEDTETMTKDFEEAFSE